MNIRKIIGITIGGAVSAALTTVALRHRSDIAGHARAIAKKADDAQGTNDAASPKDLSNHELKDALIETRAALGDKNIPMLAAGVAFFATLAFFPTLTAAVAIFSLVAGPQQVQAAVTAATTYLPHELGSLIATQLHTISGKPTTNAIAAVLSIAIALWGASGGMQNLIKATNEAYSVDESRSFIKLRLISIALVVAGILLGAPLILLATIQGGSLTHLGAPGGLADSFLVTRWIFIAIIMAIALAAFYRYGPDRKNAKWQWVSWGAGAAIVIWLLGTLLFFFYAQNFGSFSKSYGIFAGIIVLMTWFNLSSFIFLLGAEVNHRLETKTDAKTIV